MTLQNQFKETSQKRQVPRKCVFRKGQGNFWESAGNFRKIFVTSFQEVSVTSSLLEIYKPLVVLHLDFNIISIHK